MDDLTVSQINLSGDLTAVTKGDKGDKGERVSIVTGKQIGRAHV